jgi:adenylate kinase
VYIILLGAPGAGKGTQAVMLVEKLKLVQVASGDLFRKALQQETDLGKKAKSYMEKGQLVPDEITIQMVLERLAATDVKNGAILDGFPRNLEQAKALDKALAKQKKAIDGYIYKTRRALKRLGGRWRWA